MKTLTFPLADSEVFATKSRSDSADRERSLAQILGRRDPLAITVARNIRRARLAAGLNQKEAALQANFDLRPDVAPAALSAFETGRRPIGLIDLLKLLVLYKVTFAQILTGDGLPDEYEAFADHPSEAAQRRDAESLPRKHSDTCDTFEPSLMCPECLAILRKVTA